MSKVAVFHCIGEPDRTTFTNSIEQITNYDGLVTFDGIYKSVWEHREQLPEGTILFMAGNAIGKDFITKQQLLTLVDEFDCLFGWHTWTHRNLTTLSDSEIREELDAPAWYPRSFFAYPYGEFDERVIKLVKEAGYRKAYSTTQGDGSDYAIIREYL